MTFACKVMIFDLGPALCERSDACLTAVSSDACKQLRVTRYEMEKPCEHPQRQGTTLSKTNQQGVGNSSNVETPDLDACF